MRFITTSLKEHLQVKICIYFSTVGWNFRGGKETQVGIWRGPRSTSTLPPRTHTPVASWKSKYRARDTPNVVKLPGRTVSLMLECDPIREFTILKVSISVGCGPRGLGHRLRPSSFNVKECPVTLEQVNSRRGCCSHSKKRRSMMGRAL